MLRFIILSLLAAGAYSYYNYSERSKISADRWSETTGAVREQMMKEPVQQSMRQPRDVKLKNGQLSYIAEYQITARVLSTKSYWLGKESDISPMDIALGWGEMATYANISQLSIRQGSRYYRYSWSSDGPPIDSNIIARSSANMHIIPFNDAVRKAIERIKPGQVVRLRGHLVNYTTKDGWHWNSSITRTDTGDGACELMYVETVEIF